MRSAGAAALGISGRILPAYAQVEDQLSMMGWADYISPDNISAWEKANNSKLIYDNYASNDEMYSKLQLAQGNSGYDLGMNTDFMIKLLIDKNLIQKLDKLAGSEHRQHIGRNSPIPTSIRTTPIRCRRARARKASSTTSPSLPGR